MSRRHGFESTDWITSKAPDEVGDKECVSLAWSGHQAFRLGKAMKHGVSRPAKDAGD
jgi:hypothetical protein